MTRLGVQSLDYSLDFRHRTEVQRFILRGFRLSLSLVGDDRSDGLLGTIKKRRAGSGRERTFLVYPARR